MAPFFDRVYATEKSGPMIKRLTDKGYRYAHTENSEVTGIEIRPD